MKGWPEEALGSLVTTRRGCYPSSDAALLTGTLPTPKWILLRILFAHLTRPCSEELSKRWSPWQRADSQNARVRRQQPRRKQTCNLFLMHTKWGAPGRTAKERRGGNPSEQLCSPAALCREIRHRIPSHTSRGWWHFAVGLGDGLYLGFRLDVSSLL